MSPLSVPAPDVVMLIWLLWERLPPDVRRVNFEYYEPRCGHGSSLSPAIHALVAARLGEIALAERYFRQAAEIDLADSNVCLNASAVEISGFGAPARAAKATGVLATLTMLPGANLFWLAWSSIITRVKMITSARSPSRMRFF